MLCIEAHSALFLIIENTIVQKTGKRIPGCAWYKDHAQNMANVFGDQWVFSTKLCKDFLSLLRAKVYHFRALLLTAVSSKVVVGTVTTLQKAKLENVAHETTKDNESQKAPTSLFCPPSLGESHRT